jgi:DNA mismatch repair protein MutS
VKNFSIGAKRYKDHIIFLRKVEPGPCDESYGVDVAKLAGLPRSVISRAREILRSLEIGERRRALERIQGSRQKNLFDTQVKSPILEELDKLDVNKLSPIEALLTLKKLKELFEK